VSAVPADASRCDGSGDPICAFEPCGKPFPRTKSTRRFCSEECKAAFHDPDNRRVRTIVKSNKLLKGGKRSITVHLDASDPAGALLEPGKVAEIL